jgi:hypothetical protein
MNYEKININFKNIITGFYYNCTICYSNMPVVKSFVSYTRLTRKGNNRNIEITATLILAQGLIAAGRIISMKNSNDIIGN